MIRILLLLCCVLIGMEYLEDIPGAEGYLDNLDWLPLVQRIVITITALIVVGTDYLKTKSFNITILVFLMVAIIFNPFYTLEVTTITKVAIIILFFVQALKNKRGRLIG